MADIKEVQDAKKQFLDQLTRMPTYVSSQDALDDLRLRLKEDGVDILRQCSAADGQPCWLRDCLEACNRILHTASFQITESSDGGLEVAWVFITTPPEDADTQEAEFLRDWLLSHHGCIHTISRCEGIVSDYLHPGLQSVEVSSVSSLGNQSSLEHISLYRATVGEAEGLADTLSRNSALKSFKVFDSTLPEDGSDKILEKLQNSHSLEEVALSYTPLSPSAAPALAELLRTSKSLKKLTMDGVDKDCVKIVLEGLHDCSSLEELRLFGLVPHGTPFVMKYSEVFRNLKVVCVPCNDFDDACAFEFAALIETSKNLIELDVSSSSFGDTGATTIAKALRCNKTLRRLSLSQDQLTSASLVELVDALSVNATVEHVNVSEINISEEHCARLFDDPKSAGAFKRIFVIWKQDRLKELTVMLQRDDHMPQVYVEINSGVPPPDLEAFFDALLSSRTVTELSFYPRGSMSDFFIDQLVRLLRTTTTIRAVHNRLSVGEELEERYLVRLLEALQHNKSVAEFTTLVSYLTIPMGNALGKLLEVNNTLTSVVLCEYWSVEPEVARTLANSMRHNYTLLELRIEWDAEDVEGLSEVWEALRRNKALLYPAAQFVMKEADDERAAEALKKVHTSWALVDEVMKRTEKGEAEVRRDIADALSRAGAS
ncbi:unnamed protein product [Ixodes hexagonus]